MQGVIPMIMQPHHHSFGYERQGAPSLHLTMGAYERFW